MKISTVIPAHNEEGNVKDMVNMLFSNFNSNLLEVIIVNDCSSDNTGKILDLLKTKYKKLKIVHRKKDGGVGNAIRAGLKVISDNASHVLMLDCDFTKNLNDIKKVIQAQHSVDGVLGSRYMKGGVLKNYPIGKKIGNRAFHKLCKFFLKLNHIDVTNNFRFYKKQIIDDIKPYLVSSGFSINSEIGLYPIIMGYKIKEVPVSWIERTVGMGISDFKVFKVAPGYIYVFVRSMKYKIFGFPKMKPFHPWKDEASL